MPQKPDVLVPFCPVIILVKPQMGENIGAAARAMLNFGLRELRLVEPRDGWPNPSADDMSAGALERMGGAAVFSCLADAVADLHTVYATTARRRDMVKPVFTPHSAARDIQSRTQAGQKTGIVFGGERAGLDNEDIALCQNIITVPVNPEFSSLNLGQAVLLLAYEWMQAGLDAQALPSLDYGKSTPATQEILEGFFGRLEAELDAGGFFRTQEVRPTTARNIRAMFARAELSDQEVSTLHGILTALRKS